MFTFYLPEYMSECPVGWKNLIDFISERSKPDYHISGYKDKTINSYLKEFDAKYINRKDTEFSKVIFENESGLLYFVLKFGDMGKKEK